MDFEENEASVDFEGLVDDEYYRLRPYGEQEDPSDLDMSDANVEIQENADNKGEIHMDQNNATQSCGFELVDPTSTEAGVSNSQHTRQCSHLLSVMVQNLQIDIEEQALVDYFNTSGCVTCAQLSRLNPHYVTRSALITFLTHEAAVRAKNLNNSLPAFNDGEPVHVTLTHNSTLFLIQQEELGWFFRPRRREPDEEEDALRRAGPTRWDWDPDSDAAPPHPAEARRPTPRGADARGRGGGRGGPWGRGGPRGRGRGAWRGAGAPRPGEYVPYRRFDVGPALAADRPAPWSARGRGGGGGGGGRGGGGHDAPRPGGWRGGAGYGHPAAPAGPGAGAAAHPAAPYGSAAPPAAPYGSAAPPAVSYGPGGGGSTPPAPGPGDWEAVLSRTTGRHYWFNRVTGETRWDPPPPAAAAGGGPCGGGEAPAYTGGGARPPGAEPRRAGPAWEGGGGGPAGKRRAEGPPDEGREAKYWRA
jgi:hypothetical protein